jgi:hypothetical protein
MPWSSSPATAASNDRRRPPPRNPATGPTSAFVGISPDGTDLYTVYDGFLDPFREDPTSSRRFRAVVRHSHLSGTTLGATTTLYRGATGDSRSSSSNGPIDGFLGDYDSVAATDDGWIAVFNDARDAAVFPAIDTFRQEAVDGVKGAKAPAPGTECSATFGNTGHLVGERARSDALRS